MSTGPDAVAAARERRDRADPWLRAFVSVEEPRRTATAASGGALDGLPIAVKGTGGYGTPAVRRLLDAGAVPVGATSVPRGAGHQTWGWTDRGPTRNPWRGDRSPGGSSAGSAAAVAAGVVPLATGSDGAGSVRIPAAWCGVIGYKPTTGLVPGTDASGLATPGVLVRDPSLLTAWLDAVGPGAPAPGPARDEPGCGRSAHRHRPHDPARPGPTRSRCTADRDAGCDPGPGATGFRVAAWSADLGFAATDTDPATCAVARAAAVRLIRAATLAEPPDPAAGDADGGRPGPPAPQEIPGSASGPAPCADPDPVQRAGAGSRSGGPTLRDPAAAWFALREPGNPDLRAARALRAANDRALDELFTRVDLLLTPTTPAGPHGHDGPGGRMNVALTWAFNLSGHPAVSIPAGLGPDGCPVGLQLVARRGADRALLDLVVRHVPIAAPAPD